MGYIMTKIYGAKIKRLIKKRNKALEHKNYDKAWMLNMKIDNNISRLIYNS